MPPSLGLLAALLLARPLPAAAEMGNPFATLPTGAPKVFLDCPACDFDYVRTEIRFVEYVRDPKRSSIHVIVTSQRTGSGGEAFAVDLIGRQDFAGLAERLEFSVPPDATDEETRTALVRTLKLGLLRFVVRTPWAEHLSVGYDPGPGPSRPEDAWDAWVFTLNGNAYLSGERSRNSSILSLNFSADRVTPDWKTSLGASASLTEDRFDVAGEEVKSISRENSLKVLQVMSLGEHWSAGLKGSALNSTYSNTDFAAGGGPALEFNVFPYSQSTRRQLRLQYAAAYTHADYTEETIFDKTSESLWSESLSAALDATEPWGSAGVTLKGSHYLHDWSKNRAELSGNLSFRLFKGLSLQVSGQGSMIRDQLSLRKEGATVEEILLQRQELATRFNYLTSIGLTYTFGSIYSSVVNPRFGQ